MSRRKKSLDYKRIRRLVWLVLTVFVLLGCSLQGVAGSAYYSLMMQVYGMVSSTPVILQNGTAGTSTIYTNGTSAKVSVEAPSVYDFVDNNISNVDSNATIGTHSNFTAQQYGPDSLFDNLTETDNGGAINDSENFVDDNTSNIDGVDDKGTHGNFTAQQYGPDSINDTLTEGTTAENQTALIQPFFWDDVNSRWDNEANAYDWDNSTSATENQARIGNNIDWRPWNNSGSGQIIDVDLRIRIDLTGLVDDYLTVSWQVGSTQGTTYEINSTNQGTDLSISFNDLSEPNDGSWSWIDIGNIQIRQVGTKVAGWDGVTYAVDEVWGWVSASTPNYELDLEIRWTTADYDETNEYLCINVGTTDDEDLKVEVWTGSWTNLLTDLNASSWNNVSISSYLTSDTLIVRFLGGAESDDSNQDSWQIECSLLHVWSTEISYELDLEIQWTDAKYTRTNEELCIKTGTTDTEDIEIYAWNITGSSWHKVLDDLAANTWNNITVSDYLTDTNFTIRFKGGNETGDATQSSWDIDASLLHVWNDIEDYVDNNTSNVDSSNPEDKGTHSNFTTEKYSDSIYDTLTEENIGGDGFPNDWAKRINMTIDSGDIDSSLSNFPLLIFLSNSSAGQYDEDVSAIFDEVGGSYQKINVTASDGTPCYVEVEKWDSANEKAWLWVKVPSISSSTNTTICFYYDSSKSNNTNYVGAPNSTPAENVWDSNYKFVSHLRDDPDTSHIRDSTSNNNDGTKEAAGEPAVTTSGKIDGAQDFDGDNDFINTSYTEDLINWTAAVWVKGNLAPSGAGESGPVMRQENYQIIWDHSSSSFRGATSVQVGGTWYNASFGTLNAGVWYPLVGTYDGETLKAYKYGILISSNSIPSGPPASTSHTLKIGRHAVGEVFFNGSIDEVRISDTARSAAWIKATYETERDHLLDFGSEETGGTANYELDLEIQWTNANYTRTNEELCIKTGIFSGSEDLMVYAWNVSTSDWHWVMNLTASSWNNVSITDWLNNENSTARFLGGTESSDTTQDSWNIDATLLHVWTSEGTYDYVLRVNNTVTDFWQIRLKKYADFNIDRLENCTIYFHNSSDGTSRQIYIQNGLYTNQTGSWYDLGDSETIYIAMTAEATSTGTSYVRTYLEILIPNTSTYSQYIITFEIT